MRKAQVSIFVILGLVLLLIMSVYMFYVSRNSIRSYEEDTDKVTTLSDVNIDSRNYINSCIKDSVQEAIEDTGIREENINQYKTIVSGKITSCTQELFNNLESMDYKVEVSNIIIEVVFEDETISVEVIYPIVIEHDGQKIDFSKFNYVFDRSTSISIPDGVADRDITIVSSDRNTELKIKKGTKITDKDGNPVENIGIKVEDVHFDGLENMYAVGELVYDNFPDGTYFSEPIEISIEFRQEDIPEDYTTENLRISYWDAKDSIWYAYPTEVIENRVVAEINHFSKYSVQFVASYWIQDQVFQQRFIPIGASSSSDGNRYWYIESGDYETSTATIQPRNSPSKLEDYTETLTLENYHFLPNIRYGYYKNPDEPTEEEFNICNVLEEDKGEIEGDGINNNRCILDGENSYPYCWIFGNRNYMCSQEACPVDSKNICNGHFYGYSIDGKICLPYAEDKIVSSSLEQFESHNSQKNYINNCKNMKTECDSDESKCETYQNECMEYDEKCKSSPDLCNVVEFPCCLTKPEFNPEDKLIAWESFVCTGGDLGDIEGIGAAGFIEFGKNGNAVVAVIPSLNEDFKIINEPFTIMWAWPLDLELIKNNFAAKMQSMDIGNVYDLTEEEEENRKQQLEDNPDYPFYCTLKTFESGKMLEKITLPEGYGPALGYKGVYAIRKVDDARSSMQTRCEVNIFMDANGIKGTNIIKKDRTRIYNTPAMFLKYTEDLN